MNRTTAAEPVRIELTEAVKVMESALAVLEQQLDAYDAATRAGRPDCPRQ